MYDREVSINNILHPGLYNNWLKSFVNESTLYLVL